MIEKAIEYYFFYVAVFWFIVEMGWFSVGIISFLVVFFSVCLYFLSWTANLLIYAAVLGIYMYFRQNYYSMNRLSGYSEPKGANEPWKGERELEVRVLNLDNTLLRQTELFDKYESILTTYDATKWGPNIRMACGYLRYKEWESFLSSSKCFGREVDGTDDNKTLVTFYGSNDFHHLALSLIRRIRRPINLVMFDNHPDYISYPFGSHCGSWFHQASTLPTVKQAFHFGGASGEWQDETLCSTVFTPWTLLNRGVIKVYPAITTYDVQQWRNVETQSVRRMAHTYLTKSRCMEILEPLREQFAAYPLYVTLDKDVMNQGDCIQNWDSGYLTKTELLLLLETMIEMSNGRVVAIDVTGDWSEVQVHGCLRRVFHWTQHDEEKCKEKPQANKVNQTTNIALLEMLHEVLGVKRND